MKTGLVSVSFRGYSWEQVLDMAVSCNLEGIEWGGDIHVPCGDIGLARKVGEKTRESGLQVACYGSYCRMEDEESSDEGLQMLVDTAQALGAPLIRVWAGRKASCEAEAAYRDMICANTKRLAAVAKKRNIEIAFEYHGDTLTDTAASAKDLLDAVNCPAVGCLWQPPVGMSAEDCCTGIRAVAQYARNVHVFSWQAGEHVARLALDEGEKKWKRFFGELSQIPGERWMLLEFVKDDAPGQLCRDAETLKRWIKGEWRE